MVTAYRPGTLEEALEIRGSRRTIPFAGGSDLMVRYRSWSGVAPRLPAPVLMIGHLEELRSIGMENGILSIGACATLAEILEHPAVPDCVKLPLRSMASPSIRAVATLGGNIANASPAGDSLPMLYALDARLVLRSTFRTEETDMAGFITGPGMTTLGSDQLLAGIRIPSARFDRCVFEKPAGRRSNSIAKLSLYAAARIGDATVQEVRIGFGAVAPTVVRSREAEDLLAMVPAQDIPGLLARVTECYLPLIIPLDDQRSSAAYRRETALGLLERFLLGLTAPSPLPYACSPG